MRYWSTPEHDSIEETRLWLQRWSSAAPTATIILVEKDGRGDRQGRGLAAARDRLSFCTRTIGAGPDGRGDRGADPASFRGQVSDLPALTAEVDPRNAASLRLLARLGFRETHRAERTCCGRTNGATASIWRGPRGADRRRLSLLQIQPLPETAPPLGASLAVLSAVPPDRSCRRSSARSASRPRPGRCRDHALACSQARRRPSAKAVAAPRSVFSSSKTVEIAPAAPPPPRPSGPRRQRPSGRCAACASSASRGAAVDQVQLVPDLESRHARLDPQRGEDLGSTSAACSAVSGWLMSRTCRIRSADSTSSSVARKAATSWSAGPR
jgi:ribosomal-protein-alanine N-acetyltransferase